MRLVVYLVARTMTHNTPWRIFQAEFLHIFFLEISRRNLSVRDLTKKKSSGGWFQKEHELPRFHVSDTCRVSIEPDAPVATAARAKATLQRGRASLGVYTTAPQHSHYARCGENQHYFDVRRMSRYDLACCTV